MAAVAIGASKITERAKPSVRPLPARSSTRAVNPWLPLLVSVGVRLQVLTPAVVVTVALPSRLPLSYTCSFSLVSSGPERLPLIVGVGSLVLAPSLMLPCTAPTLSVIVLMVTLWAGATVSRVKLRLADAGPRLPAPSTTWAVMTVRALLVSGVPGVKVQFWLLPVPLGPVIVAKPSTLLPARTWSCSPVANSADTVPLIVGVASLVTPVVAATVPCSTPTSSVTFKMMTLCVGNTLSMVRLRGAERVPSLPAASTTAAVKL